MVDLAVKAREFLVWRVGNSVGWRCTCADIARETGIHRRTVWDIMQRRGWSLVEPEVAQEARDKANVATGFYTDRVVPVDLAIDRGHFHAYGAYQQGMDS